MHTSSSSTHEDDYVRMGLPVTVTTLLPDSLWLWISL
jgi:hypothetical protein